METFFLMKGAAVFLLLIGFLAVAVGAYEEWLPLLVVGCVFVLGGVALLVAKIIRRNQSNPL